jgi:Putative transposase/Transposase zinc-binding domain
MKAGIVQKIFNDHFEAYRRHHKLSKRESYAAWSIMTCRTRSQGYHVDKCPEGHYSIILNNSCKHRSCPQCGSTETEIWLQRRKKQALNCKYFHVIFTISHEIHFIWRYNRKLFTDTMFQAAWHTLRELLGDSRWLGAYPGVIGVFQSWGDEMQEHCHLHFVVTGGGLDANGKWKDISNDFLIPRRVLASKFRGKFLACLKEHFKRLKESNEDETKNHVLTIPSGNSIQQCLNVLNKLGRKKWHVRVEESYEHANGVFKYVGRYIRRGPISEKRIMSYDGDNINIAYAHPEKHEKRSFTLNAGTFIHRILNHVPEKGTHLVRSYGLFHPNCIEKLNTARAQLGQAPYEQVTDLPHAQELLQSMFPEWENILCPVCGLLLVTEKVVRYAKPPPLKMAA